MRSTRRKILTQVLSLCLIKRQGSGWQNSLRPGKFLKKLAALIKSEINVHWIRIKNFFPSRANPSRFAVVGFEISITDPCEDQKMCKKNEWANDHTDYNIEYIPCGT